MVPLLKILFYVVCYKRYEPAPAGVLFIEVLVEPVPEVVVCLYNGGEFFEVDVNLAVELVSRKIVLPRRPNVCQFYVVADLVVLAQ